MLEPGPHLSFSVIDGDPDFPGFAVEVRADGYAGATDIWVARPQIAEFLSALDALDSRLQGEARLTAGWVRAGAPASAADADLADADLEVTVRPYGRAGQLEADVTIRASARWSRRHTAQIGFVIPEPNALSRFRTALRTLVEGHGDRPAVLTPAFTEAGI